MAIIIKTIENYGVDCDECGMTIDAGTPYFEIEIPGANDGSTGSVLIYFCEKCVQIAMEQE